MPRGTVRDVPDTTDRGADFARSLEVLGNFMAEVLEDFAGALETAADLAGAHATRRVGLVDGPTREIERQREHRARAYAKLARTNAQALSRPRRRQTSSTPAAGIAPAPGSWKTRPMIGSPDDASHEGDDNREAGLDRRDHELAQREGSATWREAAADQRDRIADQRERQADERERQADERELHADEREGTAAERERERLARQGQAEDRRDASAHREQAQVDREAATSERDNPLDPPVADGHSPGPDTRRDRP
jgi:hypothetical protein